MSSTVHLSVSKIKVWKWNRNVLLGALLAAVAVALVAPTSSRTRAIETGARSEAAALRTSGDGAAGDVHVPSLARLSRNGAPVPEIVMADVLRAVGLRPVLIAFPSTRPEGTVLFTAPGSGVEVAPGSTVDVVASSGKA